MKKVAFVAFVLFGSLIFLQYVIMQPIMAPVSVHETLTETTVVQPVRTEVFNNGDYIVVLKEGRYYVYKRNLPAT